MIAIAEALKVNSTVTKIDVSDNEIGGYVVARHVDFAFLTATPEGPAALAEALKVNTTVQWVKVSDNALDSAAEEAVQQSARPGVEVRL